MKLLIMPVIAFTLAMTHAQAQQGGCHLAVKNTQLFLGTKTIVLLQSDKSYNEAITKAFKEHWKVTPFDFAPAGEIDKYISSPQHSIVLPVNDINTTVIAALKGDKRKKDITDYSSESMIGYADVDGFGFEPSVTNAIYRLPNMIKSMNDYIAAVAENEFGVSSCATIRSSTAKYYNKRASGIRQKTLLIDSRYEIKGELNAMYPYSIKIADKREIQAAIADKKPNHCYIASNYIFDTATGEVLHMFYDNSPGTKLTKSLFKELLTNIGK